MEQRLLGQDVTVRLVRDGVVVSTITAIGSFDDTDEIEIKEDGFLGRKSQDFSDVFNGYSGNLEFQASSAGWVEFVQAVRARAQRADPGIVFNVVRTDTYANGDSAIFVYLDVAWGAIPKNASSRKDFVKMKLTFKCSERSETLNQLS